MPCVCVSKGSPPSVYAISNLVEGRPGSLRETVALTFERTPFIGAGLFAAGVRGPQLITYSVAASTAISAFLVLWYLTGPRGMPMDRVKEACLLPARRFQLKGRKRLTRCCVEFRR